MGGLKRSILRAQSKKRFGNAGMFHRFKKWRNTPMKCAGKEPHCRKADVPRNMLQIGEKPYCLVCEAAQPAHLPRKPYDAHPEIDDQTLERSLLLGADPSRREGGGDDVAPGGRDGGALPGDAGDAEEP